MEVGIRELKARLSHYVDCVRKGETVVITDRGKPVARIEAIESPPLPEWFKRLVSEGKVIDKGPPGPVPTGVKMLPGDKTSTDYVRESRGRPWGEMGYPPPEK